MLYNSMIKLDLVDEVYLTLVNEICDADVVVDLFELSKKLKHREFIKELDYTSKVHVYKFYK